MGPNPNALDAAIADKAAKIRAGWDIDTRLRRGDFYPPHSEKESAIREIRDPMLDWNKRNHSEFDFGDKLVDSEYWGDSVRGIQR